VTFADVADSVHFSRSELQRLSCLKRQVRLAIDFHDDLSLQDIRAFDSGMSMVARALAWLQPGNHTQYLVARRVVDFIRMIGDKDLAGSNRDLLAGPALEGFVSSP